MCIDVWENYKMAASMKCGAQNDVCTLTVTKLSHKKFRAQLKKLRRKRIRQTLAITRKEARDSDNCDSEDGETISYAKAAFLANKELIKENEERERERLNREWLRREEAAQKEFQNRKVKEEQARREREENEREIREEWAALQKKEEVKRKRLEEEAQVKKDREAALLQEATRSTAQGEGPWCNPTAPSDYGSELDKHNCPFFLKTGSCRFGERCSRAHPRIPVSRTLLIPGMFTHFGLDKTHRDEYDSDMCLEYEDNDCFLHFREFNDDVLPEFKRAGNVVQFKVCRNYEPHLRGNVYVQFAKEEEAMTAFQMFNGRYYAGKQLSCEFTSITKWKSAICGLFQYNRCPKGRTCNFLHVFNNPNGEFFEADRDISPSRIASDSRRSRGLDSRRSSRSIRLSRLPSDSCRRRSTSYERRSNRSSRSLTLSRRSRSRDRRRRNGRSRSRSFDNGARERRREESRSSGRRKRSRDDVAKKSQRDDEKTSTRNGHSIDEVTTVSTSRSKKSTHSKSKHKKSSSRRRRSPSSSSSSSS